MFVSCLAKISQDTVVVAICFTVDVNSVKWIIHSEMSARRKFLKSNIALIISFVNSHFRDSRQFADKIFTRFSTIFPRLGGDSAIEVIPGKQLFALVWSDPEKATHSRAIWICCCELVCRKCKKANFFVLWIVGKYYLALHNIFPHIHNFSSKIMHSNLKK